MNQGKRNYTPYISSVIICVLFTIWGAIPSSLLGQYSMKRVAEVLQNVISKEFGWLYVLLMVVILVAVIYLLFSKYGEIKLGRKDDEPEFSYFSWVAMLFSAGMGIGLIFWGVAEPVMHLYDPALPSSDMLENAREAMTYTFFHWGLQPWALYAFIGLIIAYTTFRKDKPAVISESVTPLFAKKYRGTVSTIVDTIAIIATVFGVATSLGLGAQQITGGLSFSISWIPNTFITQLVVIIMVTVLYLISATTGLDKGVKILSNINILLAVLLMFAVLFIGPTAYLLDLFVQSIGNYFQKLPEMSFRLGAFSSENREWIDEWTIFYWSWWISWAPYVSSFIARISKGRTIREFVGGVLIVPTAFTFLWFSVFGGSGIWQELFSNNNLIQTITEKGTETGLFALLESYGGIGKVITGIAILLISTFFITSADSATYVLAMFSTNGNLTPHVRVKFIWGIIMSSIAAILLYAGGLESLQAVAVLGSFPFLFVIILMGINFFKSLRAEK
ncbi:BCCT family transporter [Carnobacterium sp.]|uniref:BCCT family transporter n=1 Tax=Carnobacterium sp. TaxID=48221 RepID=UPI00388E820B